MILFIHGGSFTSGDKADEDSPILVKLVFQQTGPASFHAEDWSGRDSSSETELTDDDLNEIAKSASGWSGKNITAFAVSSKARSEKYHRSINDWRRSNEKDYNYDRYKQRNNA